MTLKCLVQKLPGSVDQLMIPYQISLFRRTDYSFRLQNIWKQGLETWCLLIHERLLLISSAHFPGAHLGCGTQLPYIPCRGEKSLQAIHESFQSRILVWLSPPLSPVNKENTERVLPPRDTSFISWGAPTLLLAVNDVNKLAPSGKTKILGPSTDTDISPFTVLVSQYWIF